MKNVKVSTLNLSRDVVYLGGDHLQSFLKESTTNRLIGDYLLDRSFCFVTNERDRVVGFYNVGSDVYLGSYVFRQANGTELLSPLEAQLFFKRRTILNNVMYEKGLQTINETNRMYVESLGEPEDEDVEIVRVYSMQEIDVALNAQVEWMARSGRDVVGLPRSTETLMDWHSRYVADTKKELENNSSLVDNLKRHLKLITGN